VMNSRHVRARRLNFEPPCRVTKKLFGARVRESVHAVARQRAWRKERNVPPKRSYGKHSTPSTQPAYLTGKGLLAVGDLYSVNCLTFGCDWFLLAKSIFGLDSGGEGCRVWAFPA